MTAMRSVYIGLALLVLSPANVRAQGTGCDTAECVPPVISPGLIFAGFRNDFYRPGQIFAPRIRGALSEVRLGLHTSPSTPNDTTCVVIEIRTVQGGLPTSVILGQAIVPGPFAGGSLYGGSFAGQNLMLDPGTQYAITLRTTGGHAYILGRFPACDPSTGSIEAVSSFDGGATWFYVGGSPTTRSMVYQVCVDAATPAVSSSWGRVKTVYR